MDATLLKIKKLLKLSKCDGATPAEAAAALQKAMTIAEKAGINISQVPTDDEYSSSLTHIEEKSGFELPQKLAAALVQNNFGVTMLVTRKWEGNFVTIIGMEMQCHLALYAFKYITSSMMKAWRNRTNKRLTHRSSFLKGYARAMQELMPDAFPTLSEALVISTNEYIENHVLKDGGKLGEAPKVRTGGYANEARAGYEAGKTDGLRNGLNGSETLRLH